MATITLIEDDSDERPFIRRAIQSYPLPIDVLEYNDGEEAHNALLGPNPACIEIILLDLKIPRLSGLSLLEKLTQSEETKHIPVIICSGSKSAHDVKVAWQLGCAGYFAKPDRPQGYRAMIATIFDYWLNPILIKK